LAKKAGKPVKGEFSSWEEFNRFFDQLSKPAQVQYLFYELDFLEKGGHYKGEDDAWERGDSDYFAEGVKDMMRQYPDLSGLSNRAQCELGPADRRISVRRRPILYRRRRESHTGT
jgi:hypothetical protein